MSGLALTGLGSAQARRRRHGDTKKGRGDGFVIDDPTASETDRVLESRQFQEVIAELPNRGGRLDFGRAKTVRKQKGSDEYKFAVPVKDTGSFDPVTATEGLHALVNPEIDEVKIIVRYEDEPGSAESEPVSGQAEVTTATISASASSTATASTATTDGVRAMGSGCHYSDITPGYKCVGAYDTETACTIIGAAAALIPANDVTGIGVIDDVALPAVAAAGSACALEQAIEMGITDWLNACSTDNWVWEVYRTRWWNPVPQPFLAIPRCG